jgi:methionyl-tRNA formyltransferase
MRVVFAGTPEAALPSLTALAASGHELVGVVTRPDARSGRGRTVSPSPVAEAAAAIDVPLLKPGHPREPEFQAALRELAPDVCAVVAYGALLPRSALDIPAHGWVNLHFSLLPAWRGAAPVQRAVWAGDDVTGATTFRLVEELDAGPTFGLMTETIRPRDTAGDLLARLAEGGAGLLVATLDGIADGSLEARPQVGDEMSFAPKVRVEEARVDWHEPSALVDRQIRACTPAPGAWTTYAGERLKLGPVTPVDGALPPGELVAGKEAVAVGTGTGTGTGAVRLGTVQPVGRRPMAAADWVRGLRLVGGEVLE